MYPPHNSNKLFVYLYDRKKSSNVHKQQLESLSWKWTHDSLGENKREKRVKQCELKLESMSSGLVCQWNYGMSRIA